MSIDLSAYSDPSIFSDEINSIFSERLYVGAPGDLADVDSYRSFRIGRKVVTVRRTDEGIRAFSNVCLHRSNLIDPLGDGNRRFSCGFHGWSYDAKGELAFTPFTDKACIAHASLPVFPVVEADGFLFVGLSGEDPPVEKFSGAIQRLKMTRSRTFHREALLHECNWKLLVENILESYHLNFVHRGTFLKSGFTSTSTHEWTGDAYVNTASIIPESSTDKTAAIHKLARNATHSYKHAYIFPNLFISNTNDLIGFVSHLLPIGETKTLLTWELFELPEMLALPEPIRDHIRNEAINFSQVTLGEDKDMVETCQIGVTSDMGSVQLQPIEGRVKQFHDYYSERMRHVE